MSNVIAEIPTVREQVRLGHFQCLVTVAVNEIREVEGRPTLHTRVSIRKLKRFKRAKHGWITRAKGVKRSGPNKPKKPEKWWMDRRHYSILIRTQDIELAKDTAIDQAVEDGFLLPEVF